MKARESIMTHYVLAWINDGVSANAVFVSQDITKLEEKVKKEWETTCMLDFEGYDMEDELERTVDSGDGSIVFCYSDPVDSTYYIFAQIEKVDMI